MLSPVPALILWKASTFPWGPHLSSCCQNPLSGPGLVALGSHHAPNRPRGSVVWQQQTEELRAELGGASVCPAVQWESTITSPALSARGSNSEKQLSLALSGSRSPWTRCAPFPSPVCLAPGCKRIQGYFCSSPGARRVGTGARTYRKSVNTCQPAVVPRATRGNKEAALFSSLKLLKPNPGS